jgi:hypothetical protein
MKIIYMLALLIIHVMDENPIHIIYTSIVFS